MTTNNANEDPKHQEKDTEKSEKTRKREVNTNYSIITHARSSSAINLPGQLPLFLLANASSTYILFQQHPRMHACNLRVKPPRFQEMCSREAAHLQRS